MVQNSSTTRCARTEWLKSSGPCPATSCRISLVLWSRHDNGFTAFPVIAHACKKLPGDILIDGEVIVVDGTGKVSFNGLQYLPNGHIQFYVFDVLVHRGRNVLRLPLESRRELLTEALLKVQHPVIQSIPFDVKPAEIVSAAKETATRARHRQAEGLIL